MPIKPFALATDEEWNATQRLMESVNRHCAQYRAELMGGREQPGFVAIKLADGSSDGRLYDSRAECLRFSGGDPYIFPVKVGPMDIGPREAWIVLMYARQAAATGHAFTEEDRVLPQRLELVQSLIPRTFRGVQR